jgi:23S rRNA pseudouridine1911/1915/1917 synthase
MRIDVFVHSELRSTSRTRARAIVKNSAFRWDGRRLRPSERVTAEQRVVLWRPPFEAEPDEVAIPVLYEDEHVIAVDKPALIAVHPTARYHRSTLIERLRARRPGEFFSLVHRLDRETSGVLLVARSPAADRAFKRLLEDRSLEQIERAKARSPRPAAQLEKTYLAVTWGVPDDGPIELPLAADEANPLRVKMRVAPPGRGLEARTDVTVLERAPGYALVACELHTGRQHQIRVHLAAVGTPVVGDKLYGPDERLLARAADGQLSPDDLQRLELPRHALHAHRYRLPHAVTGAPLELASPLADDLQAFWNRVRAASP